MKKIHGLPQTLCEKHGLQKLPPVDCDLRVGDKVIFTNDNGVSFNQVVIGFSANHNFYGRFIHAICEGGTWEGSAGWFAHHPSQIQRAN